MHSLDIRRLCFLIHMCLKPYKPTWPILLTLSRADLIYTWLYLAYERDKVCAK